jgi:putative sterol carrier protein
MKQPKQQAAPVIDRARQERLQRFATLKPLTTRSRPGRRGAGEAAAAQSLAKLAMALKAYPKESRLQIALRGPRSTRSWAIKVGEDAAAVVPAATAFSDLHLTMDESVWREITRGELAPLAAFVTGRLRVVGDRALAKGLYRHLARSGAKSSDIELI